MKVQKIKESQLRKLISNAIRESLENTKPWINNTDYAVGNFDDSEVMEQHIQQVA